jgi:carbon monoxide dehydrogenase subunit G
MAKFKISESVEINRPSAAVFQYVTDISQAPAWRPTISIRDYSGEPFEVGTTWSEVSRFMGRDMVVNHEVTALDDGRLCEMNQETTGLLSGKIAFLFNPITEHKSTFTLEFDGEISGWLAGLASGMLRNQAQKAMKKDLASLKSKLETS